MATTTIPLQLPRGVRKVELVYVDAYGHGVKGPTTGLVFLHRVRQLGENNPWVRENALHYHERMQPAAARILAASLTGRHFDAILAPPSRRRDVIPYFEAIVDELGPMEDWTACFARREGASAGSASSYEAIYNALTLTPRESITRARAVLMVDESFCAGTTACAVFRHLLDAGLPTECQFTIAAPLWVRPKPAGPSQS